MTDTNRLADLEKEAPTNLWTEAIQMLRLWLTAYPYCGVTGLEEARDGCCRTCDTRLLLRAVDAAEEAENQ